ncbi:MAG: hypothetical protein GQ524_01975 [Anaerolineales bacterium]|nr:hypothetical protein [Anaerolineales bacterium]
MALRNLGRPIPKDLPAPTTEQVDLWKHDFVSWMDSDYAFVVDRRWEDGRWVKEPSIMELTPLQSAILRVALAFKEGGFEFVFRTLLLSFPKKSGKTALAAAITVWYAWSRGNNNEIYVIANDLEQAKERVFGDVVYACNHMPWLRAKVRMDRVLLEGNGTWIITLGMHNTSAAGSRHGLTVWDELWGYTSELHHRMWDEMTPVPTEPASLRLIVTYAGYEVGSTGRSDEKNLLWDLYSKNVSEEEYRDGKGTLIDELFPYPVYERRRVFTCWFHEPTMPWQNQEYYDDEKDELRTGAYIRLHKNKFVSSSESFIDMDWWDQSLILDGPLMPERVKAIAIGLDFAPKKDMASAVGTYYDWKTKKVKQAFHAIWRPQGEFGLDNVVVENWLLTQFVKYKIYYIGYDPYQFHGSAMRLRGMGLPMVEVPQTDNNMIPATEELYGLLKYHRFETYQDANCRAHIAAVVAEDKGRGARLSKRKSGANTDYAIALVISVYETVRTGGINLEEEIVIESPFADQTQWPVSYDAWKQDQALPFELRDTPTDQFYIGDEYA